MCGRYTQTLSPGAWSETAIPWRLDAPDSWVPRFNIAPTQHAWVALGPQSSPRLGFYRWGLVPPWAKSLRFGYRTINARAETVDSKRAFRDAFHHRRCVILADGFYEWEKAVKRRRLPHFFRLKRGQPFGFAGLFDRWKSPEGFWVRSFTIITTRANELVSPLHDRMPVMLNPDGVAAWLTQAGSHGDVLVPFPAAAMETFRVSRKVNRAGYDEPDCVAPLRDPLAKQLQLNFGNDR